METNVGSFAQSLEAKTLEFQRKFVLITCGVMTAGSVIVLITYLVTQPEPKTLIPTIGLLLSSSGGLALGLSGRTREASWSLLFGFSISAGIALFWSGGGSFAQGANVLLTMVVVVAPFFLTTRALIALVAMNVQVVAVSYTKMVLFDDLPASDAVPNGVGTAIGFICAAAAVTTFIRHAQHNQELLGARLRDIDLITERARRIATGDLTGTIEKDGGVGDVIAGMLEGLRGLVEQIQSNASLVASASNEIAAMSQQQERTAVEQSGAIEETRRTVATLLDSSSQIAASARGVAENAAATLRNAQAIASRIHTLTEHTHRITEILEIIKDVANKSELLALNAALEGAKAGEAGRGFSLVASQMQRLAESVMESVRGVKQLTSDIREATNATALATEDATKLASDTAEAAQRIRVIIEQQTTSTEQVTRAMDDIAEATHQAAAGTNQTLQAVRELTKAADRLNEYAGRFQL